MSRFRGKQKFCKVMLCLCINAQRRGSLSVYAYYLATCIANHQNAELSCIK